jgi:hypothetical protein
MTMQGMMERIAIIRDVGVARKLVPYLIPIPFRQEKVSFLPSRPTWSIASLCQTTDFTPGYIAEKACQE